MHRPAHILLALLIALSTQPRAEASSLTEVGGGGPSPFGGYSGGSYRGSPFGDPEPIRRQENFDVARVGGLGRTETPAKFAQIWTEFRKSHTYTDDGEIVSGSGMPDNALTLNAFAHYVASQRPEVTLPFDEKCKRCGGRGERAAIVRDGSSSLGVSSSVRCEDCDGRGNLTGVVTYQLVNTGRLPPLMDPPSVTRLKAEMAAAERGDSKAQLAMGVRFWEGKGVPAEPKTAISWFTRSAGKGNEQAVDELIRVYSGGRSNYPTDPAFAGAIHVIHKARPGVGTPWEQLKHPNPKLAEAECQLLVAQIRSLKQSGASAERYLDNDHVRRSFSALVPAIMAKASGGDAEAMGKLAVIRMFGLGDGKKDQAAGIEWAEKSAAKGNPDALFLLGACFEDGTGYARNYTAAHVLYGVSAALGSLQSPAKVQRDTVAASADFNSSLKVTAEIRAEAAGGTLTVERLRGLSSLPPGQPPSTYASAREPAAGNTPGTRTSPPRASYASESYGSGIVFTNAGHIFTNHHVVANATACYVVKYENGMLVQKLPARLIQKDPKTDLAIIQCEAWRPTPGSPAAPPPIAPSRNCRLGDSVFVLVG